MNSLLETLIMAGLVSREDAQRMVWLLDPEAARAYAEQVLTVAVQNGLTGQQLRLVDMLRANGFRIDDAAVDAFWRAEEQRLIAEWVPEFQRVASEQAIAALAQADGMAMWQAVDRAVIDWVEDYYISFDTNRVGSIPNINEQSRTLIGNLFNQWQRGELDDAPTSEEGLPRLIAAMEEAFGTVRGERIAVTESTRIYSMSNVEAARANEFITTLVSLSAADELVCPVCGPLHGRQIAKMADGFTHPERGMVGFPPFHVNCRCRIGARTEMTESLEIPEERWQYANHS